MVLRLGFDEVPTLERIAVAKRHLLAAIVMFALASILIAVWLSAVIARPMLRLQAAAKRIAGGDVGTQLEMPSSIREVRDLKRAAGAHAPGTGRHERAAADGDS